MTSLARALRAVLWLLSLAGIGSFLFVTLRRIGYPLELDYIEGVILDHVVRLSEGKPIYVEPSLEFIPLAYMPLFTTVSSWLARAFGPDFWQPRLVLLLSSLGVAALAFLVVRRETRSTTHALAGAAIYLFGLGIAGGHYDVARPDSFMLFLAMAGLTVLRLTTSARGAAAAGLLLATAFFAKQHAAWLALAALAHVAVNDRKRLLPFAVAVVGGCAGGYALLSAWLGPWFTFYTWDVPTGWSQVSPGRLQTYLGDRLVGTMGPLAFAAVLSLFVLERPWHGPAGLWTWTGLGALCTGVMATLDPGSFQHTFIPTIVALAVAGPIFVDRLSRRMADTGFLPPARAEALGTLLLCLQFLPLVYDVGEQAPRPRAREAREAFVRRLREIPGPVLVLYHGFYGWLAGKGTTFHHLALVDLVRAKGNRMLREDPRCFDRLLDPLRAGPGRPTIVTDYPLDGSGPLFASLAPSYELVDNLGWLSDVLEPVTGAANAPTWIYRPREPGPVPAPPDGPK